MNNRRTFLYNGKSRKKALWGEAMVAAATLASAAMTTAATAKAAKTQANAVEDSARSQAKALQQQNLNNNQLQEQSLAFTKQQNAENRQQQQDIQTTLQLLAGQENMNDRMEATKMQVKYGGNKGKNGSGVNGTHFYGGAQQPFRVTDGGGAVPVDVDNNGYGLYELYGNDHDHYHKTKGGKNKTGVGIKFNDGTVIEGEGNQNTNKGELLYITPQDALFLSKHNINGFNPRDAVMNGMNPIDAFNNQEINKKMKGITNNGEKAQYGTPIRLKEVNVYGYNGPEATVIAKRNNNAVNKMRLSEATQSKAYKTAIANRNTSFEYRGKTYYVKYKTSNKNNASNSNVKNSYNYKQQNTNSNNDNIRTNNVAQSNQSTSQTQSVQKTNQSTKQNKVNTQTQNTKPATVVQQNKVNKQSQSSATSSTINNVSVNANTKPNTTKYSTSNTNKSNTSFSKAFAEARKAGRSTFEWNGKLYNTKLKGENTRNRNTKPFDVNAQRENYDSINDMYRDVDDRVAERTFTREDMDEILPRVQRAYGGQNILLNAANQTQYPSNNTGNVAVGAAYLANNSSPVEEINEYFKRRSFKLGGRPKANYGFWQNHGGATINAGANLTGALLGAIGNSYASNRLAAAHNNAASIISDAYSRMTGIDTSVIKRDDYSPAHAMAAIRSAYYNNAPELERIRRNADYERKETMNNTLSSAAKQRSLAAINDRMYQRVGESEANAGNKREVIKGENNRALNETARFNADLDVRARQNYTKDLIDVLKYNNDIENSKRAGIADANADAAIQGAQARADALTNTMGLFGNALTASGQGFTNSFDAYNKNRFGMDSALAVTDTEGQINYILRTGNKEEARKWYDRLKDVVAQGKDKNGDAERYMILLSNLVK